MSELTRRTAIKAAGMTALGYSRILGANDRIRTGHIGVGNRGTELLHGFMEEKDAEVVALCDIYKVFLERDSAKVPPEAYGKLIRQMNEKFVSPVERYTDFRRLLDRKDIDAVAIATPDHWQIGRAHV